MIRSGSDLPTSKAALASLFWIGLQSGCFLIGYDGLSGAPDKDASGPDSTEHDGSTGTWERDGALGVSEGGTDDPLADAGDSGSGTDGDADSSVGDGDVWWTGIPPETKCGGLPGACSQTCKTGTGPCVFACDSLGACGSTCEAYTKCRATCDGLTVCSHTCGMGADSSYESKGTQTTATCEAGSTCDVTCPGNGTCSLTCSPGASCTFRCSGIACNMGCTGVKLTCADGSLVCDRKCPESAGP